MTGKRTCPGQGCGRPTTAFLCGKCVTRAERDIASLRADVDELTTTITRQSVGGRGGARKKGDDQPLPFNMQAAADADRELALLYEWADHVASRHGEPGLPVRFLELTVTEQGVKVLSPHGRAVLVERSTQILLRHTSDLAGFEDGPDLASAVWHIRRALRRLTDHPSERIFVGRCHAPLIVKEPAGPETCEAELYAHVGDTTVTCPACTATYPVAESITGTRAQLLTALETKLLPLAEILAVLPSLIGVKLDRGLVRQWRFTGRLRPHLGPWAGEQLYLGGDVLTLARTYQPYTRKETA